MIYIDFGFAQGLIQYVLRIYLKFYYTKLKIKVNLNIKACLIFSHAAFCTKVLSAAFFVLTFWFVLIWCKNIAQKLKQDRSWTGFMTATRLMLHAKGWESMKKCAESCKSMRKCAKCWDSIVNKSSVSMKKYTMFVMQYKYRRTGHKMMLPFLGQHCCCQKCWWNWHLISTHASFGQQLLSLWVNVRNTVSFRDLEVNFVHFWLELHFLRQLGQYQKLARA